MIEKLLLTTIVLITLFSCESTKTAELYKPEVTQTLVLKKGLKNPESVIYDSKRDLIYVSNVNGSPAAKDGNGYILSCDLEGNIIKEKMINGLNGPKGMAIFNDYLFVSDINTLVKINLETELIETKYESENGQFLNDVAINSNGEVFVTDTWANRIYKLENDELVVYTDNPMLDNPNGITFNNDKLYLVSWGMPAGSDQGSFKEIINNGTEVSRIAERIEGLDGIEVISDSEYFVTCFITGSLYYVKDGVFNKLFGSPEGTADLEYIHGKNIILIPQMSLNKLLFYNVNFKKK